MSRESALGVFQEKGKIQRYNSNASDIQLLKVMLRLVFFVLMEGVQSPGGARGRQGYASPIQHGDVSVTAVSWADHRDRSPQRSNCLHIGGSTG